MYPVPVHWGALLEVGGQSDESDVDAVKAVRGGFGELHFWPVTEKLWGWKKLFSGRLIFKNLILPLGKFSRRIWILHIETVRMTPNNPLLRTIQVAQLVILCLAKISSTVFTAMQAVTQYNPHSRRRNPSHVSISRMKTQSAIITGSKKWKQNLLITLANNTRVLLSLSVDWRGTGWSQY